MVLLYSHVVLSDHIELATMADYSSYSEESDFDDYFYDHDNEPHGIHW